MPFDFQVFPPGLVVWLVYCLVIAGFFSLTKAVNHMLHHMFDSSEVVEEALSSEESSDDRSEKTDDQLTPTDVTQSQKLGWGSQTFAAVHVLTI